MAYPSVKVIAEGLNIDRATARTVRGLLDGSINPFTVSLAAKDRARTAYNPHKDYVLKLEAINELIGGHGVEYIPAGSNAKSPAIDYINLGDTYTPTILRLGPKRYRVQCWGDIVERGHYAESPACRIREVRALRP
jgi:hypothetical protein